MLLCSDTSNLAKYEIQAVHALSTRRLRFALGSGHSGSPPGTSCGAGNGVIAVFDGKLSKLTRHKLKRARRSRHDEISQGTNILGDVFAPVQ